MAQTNNQQASSLSPRAPDFAPVGVLTGPGAPGVPAPVDSLGRSGVALMQGGQMCAMFILLVLGKLTSRLGWIPTRSSQQEAIVLAGLPDDALNRGG